MKYIISHNSIDFTNQPDRRTGEKKADAPNTSASGLALYAHDTQNLAVPWLVDSFKHLESSWPCGFAPVAGPCQIKGLGSAATVAGARIMACSCHNTAHFLFRLPTMPKMCGGTFPTPFAVTCASAHGKSSETGVMWQ
ncbi:hypothetical protein [Desulfatibacillum aliphaticivorans]|uniref:hypothetical protein n=1 Tax=Desulfatibacillum aliphaticivorans TaxID=218208 RepID=UPI000160151E|nr:hypothetical protein [Desulfatibacillum aliphaticivorans]